MELTSSAGMVAGADLSDPATTMTRRRRAVVLGLAVLAVLQAERQVNVAPDGGPGHQRRLLEDEADVAAGFAIAAGAGLGGAFALLVLFWRPPKEDAAT